LQLAESTFLESPLINSEILKKMFLLEEGNPAVKSLQELHIETSALRKNGEEILTISKALDQSAREKVERYISILQNSALFLFPMFLLVGLGVSFIISHSIVKRLKVLTRAVEKTGKGHFSALTVPKEQDEVGVLINTFNKMESDLISREEELKEKNEELHQSRKLASIGTLASGVAHELNNPLNNIYTTAQRLVKKTGDNCPPLIKKALDDIFGQTLRVKRIVEDLLEFARGREPQYREFELNGLFSGVYRRLSDTMNVENINFLLYSNPSYLNIKADRGQIEQVFANLFTNAVAAMSGSGDLTVNTESQNDHLIIQVSDTGSGVAQDSIEKVFEPFFTTKDKGTGLGLAIVFNIIQKHNGTIRIESEEGRGTVFTIKLPKRKQ
jgi:signal transduction histidine kinase